MRAGALVLALGVMAAPVPLEASGRVDADTCHVPASARTGRPGADAGPTPVDVNIFVINIPEIHDTGQNFVADFHVGLQWTDTRLAASALGRSLEGCVLPLTSVWNPEVRIVNRREIEPHMDDVVRVNDAGQVTYGQRYYGELSAPMNLRDFPLDTQRLVVDLISVLTPAEIQFHQGPLTGQMEGFALADWSVLQGTVETDELAIAGDQMVMPRFRYAMEARRHLGYYLWKVFVPLALIVFMSWAVFWIDPSEFGPQLGVSTSAVLTLIAFQFSLGLVLPRVPYLTRLDRFLVGGTFLVFSALAESVATSTLARRGRGVLAQAIDRHARWVFVVVYAVVVVFAGIL